MAILQVNFSAVLIEVLNRRRTHRIAVVPAGGEIHRSSVVNAKTRLTEGKECRQPSNLGVKVLLVALVVTLPKPEDRVRFNPVSSCNSEKEALY